MHAPFSTPQSPIQLPALYLYPLNESFVPKHISLINNQRVKIGRQTNAKTVPGERNGYFDSKVLSRQHAEVWEENGKIYIKDVKSSNGTFINSERLSPEGLESEPFELKTDDIVEFGIDIVGEDNKTIIHHKVAARVLCVFTELDAQAAQRAETQNPRLNAVANQNGPGNNAFNFNQAVTNGAGSSQRRPTAQPQGLIDMGDRGGNMRAPGKSGLTFDHILSRLQGELQKSRETGAELSSLTGAMNDIHETLGGNLQLKPPTIPPYPPSLPPVMPLQSSNAAESSQQQQQQHDQQQPAAESTSALSELQTQLHETQQSLANHVEKVRSLEGILAEHEAMKREVNSLRDMMEERRREMEMLRISSSHGRAPQHHGDDEFASDDDDTRSIATVVAHELERVDEEDEDQLAADEEEERRQRRDELGRPRTPEPTGMGLTEDDDEQEHERPRFLNPQAESISELRSRSPSPPAVAQAPSPAPAPAPPAAVPDELVERLETLAKQLESAWELSSRSLEAQHTTAQSTISVLEAKVASLETLVQATQTQVQAQEQTTQQLVEAAEAARAIVDEQPTALAAAAEEERARERESLTEMLNEWKKNVEGRWSNVEEQWTDERERLKRAKEEWEGRMRSVEESVVSAVSKVESGLVSLAAFQAQQQRPQLNGSAKLNGSGGLVTPPSPRSLSAESTRSRQRKKRVNSSRGRTRSRSLSLGPEEGAHETSSMSSASRDHDGSDSSFSSAGARRRGPWATDDSSASDSDSHHAIAIVNVFSATRTIVNREAATSEARTQGPPKDLVGQLLPPDGFAGSSSLLLRQQSHFYNLSTAVGVLVLSVAAAAVAWRVKPDTGV
ncbi:hypothetical protein A0H81_02129 [Grifola frondosa]|uniref:FHA domain-containing protein n=1 Tax=Grifola frondosa TaxID=5627 RepID=A0A1C7MNP0_GRIFR|nr:hypothetical protein A0H81_02129 [Grifola frondosa]